MQIVVEVSDFLYKQILKKHVGARTIARIFENATPITESDDCLSRQAVMNLLNKWYCHKEPYERKEGNTVYKGYDTYYMINFDKLNALPSVLPKQKECDFLTFLMNTINPNEMEKYMQMYKSNGKTQDSEWENTRNKMFSPEMRK